MAGGSSHLSVAMTTEFDRSQATSGNTTSSPSSFYGAEFYFQCAVIAIGVVGIAGNALVLYAMVVSEQHKKQVLIFNQNVFDFCSCLHLVVTYTVKLCSVRDLTGTLGYWLCVLFHTESLLWTSINGAVINLMSINIERYLKVVHTALSKKLLNKWVRGSAVAFAWIAGLVYDGVMGFTTSFVIDGVCYWAIADEVASLVYSVWDFVSFFVVPLFTFVFCYGRILMVIRRQASVMASHSTHGSSTTQAHNSQIQSNVIKTMILISAFYAIACMPTNVNYFLVLLADDFDTAYIQSFGLLLVFTYVSVNPFIYATKFDPVRRVLTQMMPCKKSQQADTGSVQTPSTKRTALARN